MVGPNAFMVECVAQYMYANISHVHNPWDIIANKTITCTCMELSEIHFYAVHVHDVL